MVTKKITERYALNCPNCYANIGQLESVNNIDGITTRVYSCVRCDCFWSVEWPKNQTKSEEKK